MAEIIEQTSPASGDIKRQWLAQLALTFSYSKHGTQLARTKRTGPLSIQKAFYPEGRDCAHIYLLHPPAGIVSGDTLQVDIHQPNQAHVLVTTPGANRFYRARSDQTIGLPEQKQITNIVLNAQAICEHFPLETIVYEGAEGINHVIVKLDAESVYLGWDITCLGLPTSGQPFRLGKFTQLNQIFCDGKLIYHDRIAIQPENQVHGHVAGLNNKDVFATFLAYASPAAVEQSTKLQVIDDMRAVVTAENFHHEVSITYINELIIIRYLGQHAEQCKKIFILLWQVLRPVYVQKAGTLPRIWYT